MALSDVVYLVGNRNARFGMKGLLSSEFCVLRKLVSTILRTIIAIEERVCMLLLINFSLFN